MARKNVSSKLVDGLLIMPVSFTGAAMRNSLNVLFSSKIRKAYHLPSLGTVTFLLTSGIEFIELGGQNVPVAQALAQLCEEIDPKLEHRCKPITDYAQEIPRLIMKAVGEVGKHNLVLDLTVGKKDITGSLYTSACIAQISNMVYIDVKRDAGMRGFPALSANDPQILDKVKLTQFETIGEIEKLASLNSMDFVLYKKSIEEWVPLQKGSHYRSFNQAVTDYFNASYQNSIRDLGDAYEDVRGYLANYFRRQFPQVCPQERCDDLTCIFRVQQAYEECSDPKRCRSGQNGKGDELKRRFEEMNPFFRHFPALFEMLSLVTNYRNLVSHSKKFVAQRDDAKLVLDTMLRVYRSLQEVRFFDQDRGSAR